VGILKLGNKTRYQSTSKYYKINYILVIYQFFAS